MSGAAQVIGTADNSFIGATGKNDNANGVLVVQNENGKIGLVANNGAKVGSRIEVKPEDQITSKEQIADVFAFDEEQINNIFGQYGADTTTSNKVLSDLSDDSLAGGEVLAIDPDSGDSLVKFPDGRVEVVAKPVTDLNSEILGEGRKEPVLDTTKDIVVAPDTDPVLDILDDMTASPDTRMEPDFDPDVTPEPEPEPELEIEPEPEPELEIEPEPEPELELETGLDVTPEPELEPDVTPEPELEPDVTPEPELESETEVEPELEPEAEVEPEL
jgi:hypothetical protein